MSLSQLVFASRPVRFEASTLLTILFRARANNKSANITGCLVCRDDLYMQLLEGPSEEVDRVYTKIQKDNRHVKITTLVHHSADARMFNKWVMMDDSFQSWMWSRAQVDDGILQSASTEEVLGIFERLAAHADAPEIQQ